MDECYLTRAEVRAFDRHAIEQLGIPAAVLMENAGGGAARLLQSLGIRGRVDICCGKGNNGGDGLVIARHLANHIHEVRCLLFAKPEDLSPDAALQWHIVQKMGLLTEVVEQADFYGADWIVDALFGTGLTGPVRAPFDRVIESINGTGVHVLAVDIPSGLDCDTGEPLGPCIRATHTATFVAPKAGFRNPAAATWTGQVHTIDIGVTLLFWKR
ncbi:MAG TPA: NAD(P)H-hydrate epimerase [Gemmataceae bacterium]|nr:NAD(P)H-hydrate epimerase [Gemmataceae bacterium]